ncbi:MAG TPA: PAC2 family protein [Acidimicrobiales bacterium]|nr:PAC2 family protein [Acidimicrobiales bacterium]
MEVVRWEERPELHRPVLIAAFEGWNDAGDAASTAARYLSAEWGGRRIATLDPEEFYDFTVVRPEVRLVDGITRAVDWPTNELAVAPTANHDVVFLHGIEPQLKWRTYTEQIVGLAKELGVELAVTLGALLADVPHTRPVRVTGTAASAELVGRLGLEQSRYEGPTGIVGVLHDALARAGIPSASLWATVPAYVAKTPSPKGALALVERAAALLGSSVEVVSLQIAASAYERQVSEVVDEDEDVASYVRSLEESDDAEQASELAGGDTLAAEVEQFLREHGDTSN